MNPLESPGKSAIVVDVPTLTQETCFVAIPFSPDFEPLPHLIDEAAKENNLFAIRTDQVQNELDFPTDIMHRIRSAKVVVAVLSPESGTTRANDNVLYEVGCAHALGKPTVLLTSDAKSVPSDIDHFYREQYASSDIDREGVISILTKEKIAFAISKCTRRMTNRYTDPWLRDVTVADPKRRQLINPGFWESFGKILSFSKMTQENLINIETDVELLWSAAEDFVRARGVRTAQLSTFKSRWSSYASNYANYIEPNVFSRLAQRQLAVDDCFALLHKHSEDTQAHEAIDAALEFYNKLKEELETYHNHHEKLSRAIDVNLTNPTGSSFDIIHTETLNLRLVAKNCINQARALLANLINMLQGEPS